MKDEKSVLSVRISKKRMNEWKEYVDFTRSSMPKLIEAAINEYIKNHPFGVYSLSEVIEYILSQSEDCEVNEEPKTEYQKFMANQFKEIMPKLIGTYDALS